MRSTGAVAAFATGRGKPVALQSFGVALDIDGVLIRGGRLLSGTKRSLERLHHHRIPFIYLTNGGGVDERTKAAELSKKFGIPVNESQVCLSHSPMRDLPQQRLKLQSQSHAQPQHSARKKTSEQGMTLVIGPPSVKQVAKLYGFNNPVLPEDLLRHQPSLWPWHHPSTSSQASIVPTADTHNTHDPFRERIDTVAVFHDSRDWGRDIQLICDALMSDGGMLGTRSPRLSNNASGGGTGGIFESDVQLYFSNPDFIWATDFPQPRFGQGAFRRAAEHLFHSLTHYHYHLPVAGQFGKPYPSTYHYAERMLDGLRDDGEGSEGINNTVNIESGKAIRRRVYAVGDNPMSDILGANNYGWQSILVRTGVFQENTNLAALRLPDCEEFKGKPTTLLEPNIVCEDISEAVDYILSMENI